MFTGLLGAVAALAGEVRRRERPEGRGPRAESSEVQVDLIQEQPLDLVYRKKLSPAESDMVVWLS